MKLIFPWQAYKLLWKSYAQSGCIVATRKVESRLIKAHHVHRQIITASPNRFASEFTFSLILVDDDERERAENFYELHCPRFHFVCKRLRFFWSIEFAYSTVASLEMIFMMMHGLSLTSAVIKAYLDRTAIISLSIRLSCVSELNNTIGNRNLFAWWWLVR